MKKVLSGLIVLVTLFLISCNTWQIDTQTVIPTTTAPMVPTPEIKPGYLVGIEPIGAISMDTYRKSFSTSKTRGIGIIIDPTYLSQKEHWDDVDYYYRRLAIYVDEVALTPDTLIISLQGDYYFSWTPELEVGMHTVRFTYTHDSGDMLEYSWQFYLTEE